MASIESLPLETSTGPVSQKDGWLFAATIFLSAFLLFQVQLLVAKYLLPWFGGAPAVWTTSMLFFQLVLLAGYFYAHRISGRLSPRHQSQLQIALLAAALVVMVVLAWRWGSPITAGPDWRPTDSAQPIRELLWILTASLGLPFFLLATTSPLLQRWLARQDSENSSGVYRLYAVSNFGSLLGLVSYPFLVEPNLRIMTQARLWTAGFFLYAFFAAVCAWKVRNSSPAHETTAAQASLSQAGISRTERLFWFALSMCGSVMLLSTTSLVSEDMGVVPLLWVLPLTLYLLTFILCFSGFPIYRRVLFFPAMVLVLVMATMALFRGAFLSAYAQIYVYCFVLFVICMVCHGELARRTPPPLHLTSFYLVIAAGGAAGGVFTGILAPLVFRGFWEYHLGLVMSAALVLWAMFRDRDPWLRRANVWMPFAVLWIVCLVPMYLSKYGWATIDPEAIKWVSVLLMAVPVVIAVLLWLEWRRLIPARAGLWFTRAGLIVSVVFLAFMLYVETTAERGKVLLQSRSFYGVLKVRERNGNLAEYQYYELLHGRIVHGIQLQYPKYRHTLTSYYTKGSGLGLAILNHPYRKVGPIRIGAVGMGVGTVAGYVRAGDHIRFYEINPQVMKLDLGENAVFTYLNDCQGTFEIVRGDARLSMERELEEHRPQQYDVLILDAFSSDAIPVHLLTLEAMQMYEKQLRDRESVIAVHISNRAVDLKPVVAGLAQKLNMNAVWVSNGSLGDTVSASDWVILSHSRTTLDAQEFQKEGQPMLANANAPLWTDDYSDLFSLIKR